MVCGFLSERECSFGYTYIAVRDPSMNKGGVGNIYNPAIMLFMSHATSWISNEICRGLCLCSVS